MLPKSVRHQLIRFFSRFPGIKSVILFGSRSRGDADTYSDVDIAISAPRVNQRQWLDIAFFLTEEMNSLLSFDVVRLEEASSRLKKRIQNEGKLLYGKK